MKFAVESGDVKLSETFPNQDVPTGHSCFVTAEARDIIVTVEMVNRSHLGRILGHILEQKYLESVIDMQEKLVQNQHHPKEITKYW